MNKITFEDKTKKPIIHIPPFDGLGSFKIMYHHNLKKPIKNVLKVILTVELLMVEEFVGNREFHITQMIYKYRVNVKEKLTNEDLTKIWFDSAEDLIKTYNDFEKLQFGEPHEISHSSQEQLIPMVSDLVAWYNKLP